MRRQQFWESINWFLKCVEQRKDHETMLGTEGILSVAPELNF